MNSDHESPLVLMSPEELAQYAANKAEEDLFAEYIQLPKEQQLAVYNKLNKEKQQVIWKQYDVQKKKSENPFYQLQGEELEAKYFALGKEEQLKVWGMLDEAQKKHIWAIYEAKKAQEAAGTNQGASSLQSPRDQKAENIEKETESDKIMKLTPSLRTPIINGYGDEGLVEFYKGITKDEAKLVFWRELDDRQKQVIRTASEVEQKEKALKSLEGNEWFIQVNFKEPKEMIVMKKTILT